jgi:hypothetical protein
VTGHSHVSTTMEEAFVAVQDIGDAVSETSPGMHVNVIEHVTGAFFKRGGRLPDWLVRGAGLAMAHQKSPGNAFLGTMPRMANKILQESTLSEPEAIFVDGTFSPVDVGPVGCTLVEYLLKRGNVTQFGLFVQKLYSGSTSEVAIKTVYRTDGKSLALAYASALPAAGKKGKK